MNGRYVLVPVQRIGTPTGSPARRVGFLIALVALVWLGFFRTQFASADTVSGASTSGCVRSATLWTGSAVGLQTVGISYRLRIYSETTVAYGQWSLSNGSTYGGYWWSSRAGAGATGWTEYWPSENSAATAGYLRVSLLPGTTGTVSYTVTVPGYAPASCVQVDQVRVTRSYFSSQQTAQPGGGGVAPSPTPASVPTSPGDPTAVPGATWAPGQACYTVIPYGTSTPQTLCYPTPPAGFCWQQGVPSNLDTDGVVLWPCERATAAPTPTPTPATFCGGRWWCMDVAATTTGAGGTYQTITSGNALFGQPFTNPTLTAGTTYNWGYTHLGYTYAGSGTYSTTFSATTGCAFGGTGARPFAVQDGNVEWLVRTGPSSKSLTGSHVFPVGNAPCGSLSAGATWTPTLRISLDPNAQARFQMWLDPVGYVAPTPTPGPTGTPLTVTPPPGYWGPGGATQPPVNVDVDVEVDICADPSILACAQSFPPGWGDLCLVNPTIAACATPQPSVARPNPGGDGSPGGSPVPNGVAECAAASHPPKPGQMPIDPLATEPPGGSVFDWIGTSVSNIPRIAGNAVKGAVNTGIDLVVPGECVGVVAQTIVDDAKDRVPFSWYAEVEAALAVTAGDALAIPVMDLGVAELDLADAFAAAGVAVAPYRGIIGLVPWLILALLVMRKVMGTVGAGEGGG